MMKFRKYFRGSGRVLAFVFAASVIWLLLDMAALRVSIDDVNSRLLKERIGRDRETVRHKATKRTDVAKNAALFRDPQKRVDFDLDTEVRFSNRAGKKAADVYRKRNNATPAIKDDSNADKAKLVDGKVVDVNHEGENFNKLPEVDMGVNRDFGVHMNFSKSGKVDKDERTAAHVMRKVTTSKVEERRRNFVAGKGPSDSPKLTDAPPGRQEDKLHPEHKGENKLDEPVDDPRLLAKENISGKVPKKIGSASQDKISPREKMPKGQTVKTDKTDFDIKDKAIHINGKVNSALNQSGPDTVSHVTLATPKLGKGTSLTVGHKSSVHRVMSLDVTQYPRDFSAVGQFGQPAVVPKEKELESRNRWDEGHFNVYLSEQIPVDRAIPDTRPDACSGKLVHDDLPTTSVIFCFVDEVWSTLLRSVHSVLNRSPPQLLKEIILVDDFSSKDYLKEPLEKYMSRFPKVRIVRLKERQGLIRARLAGAAVATGEVLTFLDSHVECNIGWLEPLLQRVHMDRKKVVCPVIEVISDKDMSYMLVDNFQRGVFKWPLVFGWNTLTEEVIRKDQVQDSDPIRCPVMAGGLFSIDRKYFYELGTYDPGLDVWGGENMEISFKIWMCGGEIEIIPCSRVGHIFRSENPYKFPKDRQKTVERNLARVAEVWLDEYKDLFYGHGYLHLLDRSTTDIGDLTEQKALRKKLGCKSFRWYLEKVYPELDAPIVRAQGLIFNVGTRKCITQKDGSLTFETCDLSKQSQQFNHTWMRHIQQKGSCLEPQAPVRGVRLGHCDSSKPNLRWMHKSVIPNSAMKEHVVVELRPGPLCLEADTQHMGVRLSECNSASPLQKWQFTHYYTQ
nr:polypeptide N-acetylgalactosaminyltransferase 5 [Paramormyrops kingsleyae]